MIASLRVLILEDNKSDADLLQRELKKSGLNFISEVVQTRQEFESSLQNFNPDIILSDYSLPSFDAVNAFGILKKTSPHIPFIIVSGTIGEENAVELIKNGVTDYTLKDKLFTLPPKINRALKYTEEKKEKIFTGEKLKAQAAELIIANNELIFQNAEKEKRAADLVVLSEVLQVQKEELKVANERLYEKTLLLQQQEENLIRINEDLEKRVSERTGELEKLNNELKDLNLSKDKFLTVISHDLRNPLTALLLASEELNDQSENDNFEPILPVVEIIHRSSLNILHQLNELVDWAKKQQDKTVLNFEKIHLFSAVKDSFELLKTNITQKSIEIENNVSTNIYVNADALMLRSILQNLVTNSIKYSLQGGSVKVTAECKGKITEVYIIDAGIGMDANTRDNLFTKSNAASVSGTNNETGSGIGLMLVKNFVSQHGGTLRVESEIKKGTCIIFTIPGYTLTEEV